jgi:TolA-binding protein
MKENLQTQIADIKRELRALKAGRVVRTTDPIEDTRLSALETAISTLNDCCTQVEDQLNALGSSLASLQLQINNINAEIGGKKLDNNQRVDIETRTQGAGYTVTNSLGGQVQFTTIVALLVGTGTLYVNGVNVWSNVGITVGLGQASGSYDVQPGDVITTSGMNQVYFVPYVAS